MTAKAAAIETADATDTGIDTSAADNALQNDSAKPADTLQTRASTAALKALDSTDKHLRKSVLSLGLLLCAEQMRETLTGGDYSAEKDQFVFRAHILHPAALAGAVLFDNTEEEVKAIREAKKGSDERAALASAYVKRKMTKETGYVFNVKTQRTDGFRLAKWARLNKKAELINIARVSMGSIDAAEIAWGKLVAETFGLTHASLHKGLREWAATLAKPGKPKSGKVETLTEEERAAQDEAFARQRRMAEEKAAREAEAAARDPLAAIMASVEELSDAHFAALLHRLAAHATMRGRPMPEAPRSREADEADVVEMKRLAA